MQWLNEPAQWREENGDIIMQAGAKTDFWRVTLHNFIKDDAHVYYEEATGDFTATVRFTGAYTALYDQAGLMIRHSETVWMKCGVEYLHGVQQASAVITRDFSDWSILPLNENPASVWVRAKRTGSAVEVYYSLDGETFTMIRQGYLTDAETVQVGMMCASPTGEGFEVRFSGFNMQQTG